jgi:iron complex outermembrane receptor protein
LTIETEDFLPRVILRWQPSDSTMIFGSYALGVVPGDVNQQFLNADDRERPQYLAVFPNLAESTPQEELTSIEFGLKQYLWNGRAYFNASIFFQEWTGIKGRSSVAVNETCDASGINEINVATGCTYPGVMVGDGKMIDDPMNPGTLIPFLNARNVLLDGDADINGLELEFGGQLNDYISLDAAVAYVDTEYTRYIFNFVQRIAGFSDMRGNSTPRTPEWSGNLSSTFRMPTAEGREVFVRADLNYMGEVFTDETNLAYLEDYWIVNLRGGFDTERYRVEGYIKNLFNEEKWTTGARFSDTAFPVDFTNFFVQQGVNLTPQNKTEVGLRALFRF